VPVTLEGVPPTMSVVVSLPVAVAVLPCVVGELAIVLLVPLLPIALDVTLQLNCRSMFVV